MLSYLHVFVNKLTIFIAGRVICIFIHTYLIKSKLLAAYAKKKWVDLLCVYQHFISKKGTISALNVCEFSSRYITIQKLINRTPLKLTSHVQLDSLHLRCYTLLFDDSFLPVDNNFDLQVEDSVLQKDIIYVLK